MAAFPMIQPTYHDYTEAGCLTHLARIPRLLADIVIAGARRADITVKELRAPGNRHSLVAARRWVIVEARRRGFSFPEIGRAINRDHTTVLASFAKANKA